MPISVTAGAPSTLTVSPASLSPGTAAGTANLSVTSNCANWAVSGVPSWMALTPASGSNNATITVSYQANTSPQSRTATLTFSGCGQTQTVTVTQAAGQATLTVSPASLSPGAAAGTANLSVASNCANWAVSGVPSWMTLTPASGANNATITVSYQANTSLQSRTATLTFNGCGQMQDVVVTQAAGQATLTVSPASLSPGAAAGTANLSVTSNCALWVVNGAPEWLTVAPSLGSDNGTVTLTYQANTAGEPRTAELVFSGCAQTQIVTVTQAGAISSTLVVSPLILSPLASGGSNTVSVTSNCSNWMVSGAPSWIELSPTSGSGNSSVNIGVQANATAEPRTATLTFSGCGQLQTVTVTQAGTAVNYPWVPSPTSNNHTLILPASLSATVDGQPLQHGDLIGVFYDRDGALHCSNFVVWEGQPTAIAAYGNDAETGQPKNGLALNEVFKIRVYRVSAGEELPAQATYAPVGTQGIVSHTNAYADNGISLVQSLSASTASTLDIPLSLGWNMISSYVMPAQPNMSTLLSPISGQVILLKNNAGQTVIPSFGINNVGAWVLREGYQVKVNAPATLQLTGVKADPASTPIPIVQGWQMIAYLRDQPGNASVQLASIASQVELLKNNAGQAYIPALGINQIGELRPTQGYKLKASSSGTLTYPANFAPDDDEARGPAFNTLPNTQHFVLDSAFNTGNNSTVVFMQAGVEHLMQPGDEVGVFTTAGTLCGAAVYDGQNFAVTAWGDDPTTTSALEGMTLGEAYVFKVWSAASNVEWMVQATFAQGDGLYQEDAVVVVSMIDVINSATEAAKPALKLQVFPNPARDAFTVRLPEGTQVLSLYDASGRLLRRMDRPADAQLTIPTLGLARGMVWVSAIDHTGRRWYATVVVE